MKEGVLMLASMYPYLEPSGACIKLYVIRLQAHRQACAKQPAC